MPSVEKCIKVKTCSLIALNTIVIWGYISFRLPVPGLISSMICLITYKFTTAQRQTSSAFTHAYVHSKAYVPRSNDQSCICPRCSCLYRHPDLHLLLQHPLAGEGMVRTLRDMHKLYWGQRNPVPGQQVAAINCCQTTQRGLGELQPPWASKDSKLNLCTGWEKLILCCVRQHLVTISHKEKEDKCKPLSFQCTAYKQLYPRDKEILPPNWQLFPGDVQILFCWCAGKDLTPAITPSGQTSHKETL